MTQSFSAQVRSFNEKAKRNMQLVLRLSAQEVFSRATTRQASIKETGTFEVGKLPVDWGELIGETRIEVLGASVTEGSPANATPPDIALAVALFDAGEDITLIFSSDHARFIEYGTSRMPGRFYVRTAVADWQAIVDEAARKVGR